MIPLSRFFLILILVCAVAAAYAGDPIRGIPSAEKVAPRVINSLFDLPSLTEAELAALEKLPPVAKPEAFEISEEEFKRLKGLPKPEHDGRGILTIDPTAGKEDHTRRETYGVSQTGPVPVLSTNFEGNLQGGSRPGDLMVAVGPNHVIGVANSTVRIYTKNGVNITTVTAGTFFGWAFGGLFDPKVAYDIVGGRFIVLFDQYVSSVPESQYFIAISKTSDPTDGWYTYRFDMRKDGQTTTSNWADFPGLGFDDIAIYTTANMYTIAGDAFQYVKTRVFDKIAMYNGDPVGYVDIIGVPVESGSRFTLKPAMALSNLSGGHLLITPSGGGTVCRLFRIVGAPASPVLEHVTDFTVSNHGVPPDGEQRGCATTRIESNDARTQDPVWRDGYLHSVNTAGVSMGGGSVAAIRYYRINTNTTTLEVDETYGSPGTYYMFPGVSVDSRGTAYIGYTRSSSTEYASGWFAMRRWNGKKIQPSGILKEGILPYWCNLSAPRWGDYTGVAIDPTGETESSSSAWVDGNWAKSGSSWGSWIGKITSFYHTINGTVFDDCDSNAATSGDRTPIAGATVTLYKDTTILIGTVETDGLGRFAFSDLEEGTYTLTFSPPDGATVLDVVPGTGGAEQARMSSTQLHVVLTGLSAGAEESQDNYFLAVKENPGPVASGLQPDNYSVGEPDFTLTVYGTDLEPCSIVRIDGEDRATTYISPTELQAVILGSDIESLGSRLITVSTPTPGGGESNPQKFTVRPPAPVFSAEPGSLDFGEHLVGSLTSQTVRVTNDGTAPLVISNVAATTGDYSVSPTSATIERQEYLDFTIEFTPTAPGPRNADIVFTHDASSSPDDVHVTGMGLDSTRYRTATASQWGRATDLKGKQKGIPHKPDRVFFKFNLVVPIQGTFGARLLLEFSTAVLSGKVYASKAKDVVLKTFTGKKVELTFSPPIAEGEIVQVEGVGKKGKPVKVKYAWGDNKKNTATEFKNNDPWYPLPNLHNVGEELFPKGFGQLSTLYSKESPLLVGVPRGTSGASSVKLAKYGDVVKSLFDAKTAREHTLGPTCLNRFDNFDSIKSQQSSLPPTKKNNVLFGEVLALKLNVSASMTGKFPAGLGELTFDDADDASNPFNGQMIKEIIKKADTLLACLPLRSKSPTPTLHTLLNTVVKINTAFSDTNRYKDTVSFATKTRLQGVRPLGLVSFLRATPGVVPHTVPTSDVVATIPAAFALHQNYPNPFNPITMIHFDLPVEAMVTLKIYNLLGQEVASLVDFEFMYEGTHEVEFHAGKLASGVYFYRLVAEGIIDGDGDAVAGERFFDAKKMLLVR